MEKKTVRGVCLNLFVMIKKKNTYLPATEWEIALFSLDPPPRQAKLDRKFPLKKYEFEAASYSAAT